MVESSSKFEFLINFICLLWKTSVREESKQDTSDNFQFMASKIIFSKNEQLVFGLIKGIPFKNHFTLDAKPQASFIKDLFCVHNGSLIETNLFYLKGIDCKMAFIFPIWIHDNVLLLLPYQMVLIFMNFVVVGYHKELLKQW